MDDQRTDQEGAHKRIRKLRILQTEVRTPFTLIRAVPYWVWLLIAAVQIGTAADLIGHKIPELDGMIRRIAKAPILAPQQAFYEELQSQQRWGAVWAVILGLGSIGLAYWKWFDNQLPMPRFSLRTLILATTLVAVVLGAIVWLR